MLRPLIVLAVLVAPAGAHAAERSAFVSSFSRVRVQGAYEVTITTGRSPSATVRGDRGAIDSVEVRVDGTTLTVRPAPSMAMQRTVSAEPIQVALATPSLAAVAITGATRVRVSRMKADRVDLSISGTGALTVDAIEADQANAALIGAGSLTLAGKAARVRLSTSGSGMIDAARLDAGDLSVQLDGTGETRAAARYTAHVTNSGVGRVSVAGAPKCRVASAGGAVACGRP